MLTNTQNSQPQTSLQKFTTSKSSTWPDRIEKHRDVLQLIVLWLLLFIAYSAAWTFSDYRPSQPMAHWAFAHALPPVIFGWIGGIWMLPLLPKSEVARAIILLPASILASVMMLGTTTLLLGFGSEEWADAAATPGLIWSIMLGMSYFFVAFLMGVLCELDTALNEALKNSGTDQLKEKKLPEQFLVRTEGGILTVPVIDVIRLEAADDYCEIVTPTQKLLARMSLADCERKLEGYPFLRIHRSHMINLAHLIGAEPAGNGRLQASMRNGDKVVSSRAGAQALRAAAN
jgi:LytTr DNA-binding domain